ncbi:MAG: MFS transporter [Myxococcales bacterium]|nr:MFS transporter [Myxococcales bacterium]
MNEATKERAAGELATEIATAGEPGERAQTRESLRHLERWRTYTLLSLVFGYTGYYFCRSDLSVATPLLLESFKSQGIGKAELGLIASAGIYAYAIGKVINGVLVDFLGGRAIFILAMLGSIVCTFAFGLGAGLLFFVGTWSLNRYVQSSGWTALVKVASRWFGHESYGRVMGILSLSYLFGDAVARLVLGSIVQLGLVGWRGVFFFAAAILTAVAIGNKYFLRGSPTELGHHEPKVSPTNLYGHRGEEVKPQSLVDLLRPMVGSLGFWLVCVMSIGLTLIRETFNMWTPTYLYEVGKLSKGGAAMMSTLFPLFGGVSVLLAGYLTDRISQGRRGVIIVVGTAALALVLLVMSIVPRGSAVLPVLLVSLAAILMIGPYSFLAGVIALDLGGKRGSASASGFIDGAGYFGAAGISGYAVGKISDLYGWSAVFVMLAIVAGITCLAAIVYAIRQERRRAQRPS